MGGDAVEEQQRRQGTLSPLNIVKPQTVDLCIPVRRFGVVLP
jgi:hypothetical protein